MKSIMAGEQSPTIFKDTRKLAETTVDMVTHVLDGKKPEVNDTKTYDNGVKVVPPTCCSRWAIDKANIQQELRRRAATTPKPRSDAEHASRRLTRVARRRSNGPSGPPCTGTGSTSNRSRRDVVWQP